MKAMIRERSVTLLTAFQDRAAQKGKNFSNGVLELIGEINMASNNYAEVITDSTEAQQVVAKFESMAERATVSRFCSLIPKWIGSRSPVGGSRIILLSSTLRQVAPRWTVLPWRRFGKAMLAQYKL